MFVALSGHAVSTTGRDLEGRWLPLYFFSSVHGNWWAPVLPYTVAAILKVVPLSEASVRAPVAIAAIGNVLLVFFAARLLFERPAAAWIAALVLALAPLHVIESRFANDASMPVTFAAAWALAMVSHARPSRRRCVLRTTGQWRIAGLPATTDTRRDGCLGDGREGRDHDPPLRLERAAVPPPDRADPDRGGALDPRPSTLPRTTAHPCPPGSPGRSQGYGRAR